VRAGRLAAPHEVHAGPAHSWECANHAYFNTTLYNSTDVLANFTLPGLLPGVGDNSTVGSGDNSTSAGGSIPSALCSVGHSTLLMAFVAAVLLDLVLQLYTWFLTWRFTRKLVHQYANLQTKMAQSALSFWRGAELTGV
jgi:hypothetical protein